MRRSFVSDRSVSVIEQLESRMLLSSVLDNAGVFRLVGGPGNDSFNLTKVNGRIQVIENGRNIGTWGPRSINKIYFDGGGGNNSFRLQRDLAFPVEAYGGGGKDTITTGAGNDTVYGGSGDGLIDAGGGKNLVRSRSAVILDSLGVFHVVGSSKDDSFSVAKVNGRLQVTQNGKSLGTWGEKSIKKISFDAGSGTNSFQMPDLAIPVEAYGGSRKDTIVSGSGADTIYGGAGSGFIDAGDGNNMVWGMSGNHRIITGSGNDTIDGGTGADTVNSGTGHDVFAHTARMVKNTGAATLYQPLSQGKYESQAFNSAVTGYDPAQIRQAYNFGPLQTQDSFNDRGCGQTIYVVDAFAGVDTRGDLEIFSKGFNLPIPTADTFQIVNVSGRAPAVDAGWALEQNLDVEWAHAIAPGARIVLVRADTNFESDMYQGVLLAAQLANKNGGIVSMSFGRAGGLTTQTLLDSVFQTYTNVTFVASSGDGVLAYPGGSPYVTDVGGTQLQLDSQGNLLAPESAWIDGGAGAATNYERPTYQNGLNFQITQGVPLPNQNVRGVPDVSYNADPATGFAVYSSTAFQRDRGWFSVGGTSAGAPQWAAIAAVANQKRAENGLAAIGNGFNSLLYEFYNQDVGSDSSMPPFTDITTGTALGFDALPGYDLATGLGTPNGDNLIFWLGSVEPFFIQQPFTFNTTFTMAQDTPALIGATPHLSQPRGGFGTISGGEQVELLFTTNSSNPWYNPTQAPVPDVYFDLPEADNASQQTVHLFRTKNADGVSGAIYGNGIVRVFNYDSAIMLPNNYSEFTVKYNGSWSTDAAGKMHFAVSYQAVSALTGQPIDFDPYTSLYSFFDPTHGGYVSGDLAST